MRLGLRIDLQKLMKKLQGQGKNRQSNPQAPTKLGRDSDSPSWNRKSLLWNTLYPLQNSYASAQTPNTLNMIVLREGLYRGDEVKLSPFEYTLSQYDPCLSQMELSIRIEGPLGFSQISKSQLST